MSPQDKVLDKLAKLKRAAEGEARIGNAAAAEAFAEAINRMLLEHELSMADVEARGNVEADPIIEQMVDLKGGGIEFKNVRIGWQERLAEVVADAHMCRFLISKGSNRIWFVGTKQHVLVAEYAYCVLARSADEMSYAARERWWKEECGGRHLTSGNFRQSWLRGFIERIAERFADARRKEVAAAPNSNTALMVLSTAMTRAKSYVDDKFKDKKPLAAASLGYGSMAGRKAGRAAADAMNLGQRGVEGGARGLLK